MYILPYLCGHFYAEPEIFLKLQNLMTACSHAKKEAGRHQLPKN
jgi:hypothetical protein